MEALQAGLRGLRSDRDLTVFIGNMGGMGRPRVLGALALGFLCAFGAPVGTGSAALAPATKTVRYHGLSLRVPGSWPVVNLGRDRHACVRFDRHALYLGTPSPEENCPARAFGRTEALLVQPVSRLHGQAVPAPALAPQNNATTFVVSSAGVEVTATWWRAPQVLARALGRSALPRGGSLRAPPGGDQARRRAHKAIVYTGLGFDRCAAPSRSQMKAWAGSPYRAVGIYIGGVNSACAQPNLTPAWVSDQVAAGWALIPTYVGLQAPTNGCGCQGMSAKASKATAQGRAAAADAVTEAQALGLPAGSTLYDDMEGYKTSKRNVVAVLAFLKGWTAGLHAAGYLSGVYSSSNSGMHDLVAKYGTSYLEPDDIWIADWNGQATTSDPAVPSRDWANHQRLHQFLGGKTATYGKVTLQIDENYLDGGTAAARGGYLLLSSNGAVHHFGEAKSYGSDLGKLKTGVTAVSLAIDPATGGYWILTSDGGIGGFNAPVAGSLKGDLGGTEPVELAGPAAGGYLVLTSDGGVHPFGGVHWYGSDAGRLPTGVTAVSFALDPKTGGYWILRSDGGVDSFHAPFSGSLKHKLGRALPVAIAAPPKQGYLILASNGGVHKFGPAAAYGSDAGRLPSGVSAVALATSPTLAGYRILRSDGGVDSFDSTWAGSLLDKLATGVAPVALVSAG